MYRVFEALDELVTIVEEARGLPMTASCVVPRGDVLELLDDVRDALPGEMDDAQDVLDHRDQMINDARATADKSVADAEAEADRLVHAARTEATATVAGAQAEADRLGRRGLRAGRVDPGQRTGGRRPHGPIGSGPARRAGVPRTRGGRTADRRRPGHL